MDSDKTPRIIAAENLGNSKEIIFELLRGTHIYNGKNFSELKENEQFYSDIFQLMNLKLFFMMVLLKMVFHTLSILTKVEKLQDGVGVIGEVVMVMQILVFHN